MRIGVMWITGLTAILFMGFLAVNTLPLDSLFGFVFQNIRWVTLVAVIFVGGKIGIHKFSNWLTKHDLENALPLAFPELQPSGISYWTNQLLRNTDHVKLYEAIFACERDPESSREIFLKFMKREQK